MHAHPKKGSEKGEMRFLCALSVFADCSVSLNFAVLNGMIHSQLWKSAYLLVNTLS